ncbi:MAG: hypothetical protein ACRCZD_22180 [Phycicoccus sp.]
MAANDLGQLAYSISSSGQAQQDMRAAGTALLSTIEQRTGDTGVLAAAYHADGVSEDFQGVERLWQQVAEHVRTVMAELEGTLGESDGIATTAMTGARTAVDGIRIL